MEISSRRAWVLNGLQNSTQLFHAIMLRKRTDWIAVAMVFLAPVFFLTIKGWTNFISIVLFLFCIFQFFKRSPSARKSVDREFWLVLVCLIMPFLSELVLQVCRGTFDGPAMDGPVRSVVAGVIFVYFVWFPVKNIARQLALGAMWGIIFVYFSISMFEQYFWNGRFATYFVDPITLPCFLVAMLALVINQKPLMEKPSLSLLMVACLSLMVLHVSLGSMSRSSWVSLYVLGLVFLYFSYKDSSKYTGLYFVLLLVFPVVAYFASEVVKIRVDQAVFGIEEFLNGDSSHSVSQRLSLLILDLELLRHFPLIGLRDGQLPPYEDLRPIIPWLDKSIYEIKLLAGSHTEIMAQLVRKGLFLGGSVLVAMFFYPMFFFYRYSSSRIARVRVAARMGLAFVISILASSLTIQVFNLKMTSTFYGFCVALLMAAVISESRANQRTE